MALARDKSWKINNILLSNRTWSGKQVIDHQSISDKEFDKWQIAWQKPVYYVPYNENQLTHVIDGRDVNISQTATNIWCSKFALF